MISYCWSTACINKYIDPRLYTQISCSFILVFNLIVKVNNQTMKMLLFKMSEKFNLKWNDFHSNVSKSFGIFRNESYLHDVTLVSDDFKQIPAHKLVLSASSEYFKTILQQTKQSQPLICLDGVNSEDLKNVLDYVYDGEVKIHQEDLDRFLSLAQRLKLEGLLEELLTKDEELNTNNSDSKFDPELWEDSAKDFGVSNTEQKLNVTRKKRNAPPRRSESNVINVINENGEIVSEEDHKQRLMDIIEWNPDKTATCKVCGRNFERKNKAHAMSHVEIHIEGLSYPCSTCSKLFR